MSEHTVASAGTPEPNGDAATITARPDRFAEMDFDRELLRAHVAGDPAAFTELVRRHRDRMWAVALRTLGDRQEAEDALQDAMISAFRHAHSYRGEAAVTTWLHRVVVNACLDRVRRRQARPSVPLGDRQVVSHRDEHAATEARLDVRAALARLPEGQRQAIVLIDMEQISVAEAAGLLGVAEGTVKSRCSRGRAALAVMLRTTHTDEAPDEGNRASSRDVGPASPMAAPGGRGTRGAPATSPPSNAEPEPTQGGGAA
jgi:RNA polymerase sigma-70 factor (ECF subfamily)